jgi:hypothetical protein
MQINVRVIPAAKLNKISEMDGGLRVHITTAPQDGKANDAVIKLLAKHFGKSKSNIKVIRGHMVRDKVIFIQD